MKKYNCNDSFRGAYDFFRGAKVRIREILKEEQSTQEETYFVLALHDTDEKVRVWIEKSNAFLIRPNAVLFYSDEDGEAKGYTMWRNGVAPFGVELPQEV